MGLLAGSLVAYRDCTGRLVEPLGQLGLESSPSKGALTPTRTADQGALRPRVRANAAARSTETFQRAP